MKYILQKLKTGLLKILVMIVNLNQELKKFKQMNALLTNLETKPQMTIKRGF